MNCTGILIITNHFCLTGEMEEIIQIQKDSKLYNLAYLTAATHGYDQIASDIKASEENISVPDPDPQARFLRPPPPIKQAESNWPLLTVSRVRFFLYYSK